MATFSSSTSETLGASNKLAWNPSAAVTLPDPNTFESNFLTRIVLEDYRKSILSGNGSNLSTCQPFNNMDESFKKLTESCNKPLREDSMFDFPVFSSKTDLERLSSQYRSSSTFQSSNQNYALVSPLQNPHRSIWSPICLPNDQISHSTASSHTGPYVHNRHDTQATQEHLPNFSMNCNLYEDNFQEIYRTTSRARSLLYRKSTCSSHKKFTVMYCDVCKVTICRLCSIFAIGEHYDHHLSPKRYCEDSRLDIVEFMNVVISEICDLLHNAGVKIPFILSAVYGHLIFKEQFESNIPDSVSLNGMLVEANRLICRMGNTVIDCNYVLNTLDSLKIQLSKLSSCEDKVVSVRLLPLARTDGGPSAEYCVLKGQGLAEVVVNQETCVYLLLKNNKGETCELKDTPIDINAVFCNTNTNRKVAVSINSHELKGIVKISFKFPYVGLYNLSVRVNSEEVPKTPVKIYAKNVSKFSPFMSPVTLIGDEESFNKPYGAAVDKNGNLYVADRCNNCVKVLYKDFSFKMTIGESGSQAGQLRKPSGIAVDTENNLVICDKDNHRVQIFSTEGEFLRCSSEGALSFPWCVAVNSVNQYVVTHNKNRICLLTSKLEVIRSIILTTESVNFSLKATHANKRLLSPRGVCIGFMDEILVTDFETGAVYSVKPESGECIKVAEAPRAADNVQRRLQGIILDSDGYLLVADSKNCVINVFTYSGELVSTWKVAGKPVSVAEITKNSYLVTTEEGESSFVSVYAKCSRTLDGFKNLSRKNDLNITGNSAFRKSRIYNHTRNI